MSEFLNQLDTPNLEAMGIHGWPYGYSDQVRFHELDPLNHVNNASYLSWFENVRVRYFQYYGLSSYGRGDDDPQIVVRQQSVDYLAPMFQDERYVVTARTRLLKTSSLIMDYAVHSGGAVRASGSAVLVSLEQDGTARRPHKDAAIKRILATDGAERA